MQSSEAAFRRRREQGSETPVWRLSSCSGISIGAAREKVRVAHALAELPQVSAMFSEGRISYSKVRAMTRVATPENEKYLLMIARHGTAHHVERQVRLYRRVKRSEALDDENTRHDQRELDWSFDDEGNWIFRGRFTPEQGALIQRGLERVMEELYQEQKSVPAGTFLHCSALMSNRVFISRLKPPNRSGWANAWTINWRSRGCWILNNSRNGLNPQVTSWPDSSSKFLNHHAHGPQQFP